MSIISLDRLTGEDGNSSNMKKTYTYKHCAQNSRKKAICAAE